MISLRQHLLFVALTLAVQHLPFLPNAVAMFTEQGYLCNLCHSLQNEYPYPPPDMEERSVRFTQSQIESYGSPLEIGNNCLDIWNIVLDYANPNIVDESSCRGMAAFYAPQCCNSIPKEDEEELRGPQKPPQQGNSQNGNDVDISNITETIPTQENGNITETILTQENDNDGDISIMTETIPTQEKVQDLSLTQSQVEGIVLSRKVNDRKSVRGDTENQQRSGRISSSTMGMGRNSDTTNDEGNSPDSDNNKTRRMNDYMSHLRG